MYELYMIYKDYCKHHNSYNSSLYIKESTQYIVYSLLFTVHCILWTVYSIQYTLQNIVTALHTFFLCVSYTWYDKLYNVDCGLFTVNCIQYMLDWIMYLVCVLCTAFTRSLLLCHGTIVTCEYFANYARWQKTLLWRIFNIIYT
jgi:uncharacterized membrane protein YbjE (DUF340 family)